MCFPLWCGVIVIPLGSGHPFEGVMPIEKCLFKTLKRRFQEDKFLCWSGDWFIIWSRPPFRLIWDHHACFSFLSVIVDLVGKGLPLEGVMATKKRRRQEWIFSKILPLLFRDFSETQRNRYLDILLLLPKDDIGCRNQGVPDMVENLGKCR